MSREILAVRYVNALEAYEASSKPVIEFDRMLNQWRNQRHFTWAGIKLEMTDEVAKIFRQQLAQNMENLRQDLNIAREALNA